MLICFTAVWQNSFNFCNDLTKTKTIINKIHASLIFKGTKYIKKNYFKLFHKLNYSRFSIIRSVNPQEPNLLRKYLKKHKSFQYLGFVIKYLFGANKYTNIFQLLRRTYFTWIHFWHCLSLHRLISHETLITDLSLSTSFPKKIYRNIKSQNLGRQNM